ncbi:hypothetical protein P3T18_000162 [Paraburkholderia sp. GAS199]|uniref:hypothetical protein n=1 Tax=Paraburkholderia sp. GAS199 TaxID=3035126 RepID=UPI003D2106FE
MTNWNCTDEWTKFFSTFSVANSPATRDEFYAYLPIAFSMMQVEGASASTIAAYLDSITSERIGLDANPEHFNRVAQSLLDWKTEVRAIFARPK